MTPLLARPIRGARRPRASHVEWLAVAGLAAVFVVGAVRYLRASEFPQSKAAAADQAVVGALGAPSGVLLVVNPANCTLTAADAAVLNRIAAVPGLRVRVLLLAIAPEDSALRAIRQDFGFAPAVALAAASTVDPEQLPTLFQAPFVAVAVRGQLRHAAWGESLKTLGAWLPALAGTQPTVAQPLVTGDAAS